MRVGLHAVAATKQGASTDVIAGTIRGLKHAAPENDYVVFLNSQLDIDLPSDISRVDAAIGSPISRVVWDQLKYPQLLKRLEIDVSVACFGFSAIRPGIPQVVILQNALYFCAIPKNSPFATARQLGLETWILRQVIKSAAGVVVPSNTMADGVRRWFKPDDVQPVVIPDAWNGKHETVKPRAWNEPWKLVYVAHLERHKAHLELIEIAQALRSRGRKATFSIGIDEADEPEIYSRLMTGIARNNLQSYFDISGRVPRSIVIQRMREANCFVSPTRCESFGYSYLEATGAGIPIISSDIPIAREMLGQGALYYTTPAQAVEHLEWLASEPERGRKIVMNAREHQRKFVINWGQYGERLANIIANAHHSCH